MTITTTDIANRALIQTGSQKRISSTNQDSVEAQLISAIYATVVDWCHAVNNWNFARKTLPLTLLKTVALPPGTWSAATSPAPPWKNEFALPNDFIRAMYLTNNTPKADASAYIGEPARFVIATDVITGSAQQTVLLTDQTAANLVYTARISDPTLWPAYFERFVVASIAQSMYHSLTGDKELLKYLEQSALNYFSAAETINRAEGYAIADTTPELIQAIGLTYPYQRDVNMKSKVQPRQQPDDNSN